MLLVNHRLFSASLWPSSHLMVHNCWRTSRLVISSREVFKVDLWLNVRVSDEVFHGIPRTFTSLVVSAVFS